MTSCTFDNPISLRREYWIDGKKILPYPFKHQVDIGSKFQPGFVYGDASALDSLALQLHKKWRKLK
jgi:hypothetical protein